MSHRLDYPVFDVDNHMYEQKDAFTRYMPDEQERHQMRAGGWSR
jgi:hypothetical protein